jgi:ribonuclease HI
MAMATSVGAERAHCQGKYALFALLDCSKCYERVGHAKAGERARQMGLSASALNLIFGMYSGSRHVRVHGAVAGSVSGFHGIVAGCAFAPDILKCFLTPASCSVKQTTFRSYVDDIAVAAKGDTPLLAAYKLQQDLVTLKAVLRGDGMVLNDLKGQVFGRLEAERAAWRLVGGSKAVEQARDLGVMHVSAGGGGGQKGEVMKQLVRTSERMSMIPGPQEFRAKMITAVAYGKIMYGCEVSHLNDTVLSSLRKVVLRAMGGVLKYGDARAALLDYRQGAHEPVLVMARRIIKAWMREASALRIDADFWRTAGRSSSPGPVGSLQKLLVRHGVQPNAPLQWQLPHREVRLGHDHDALNLVLDCVKDSLWRELSCRKEAFHGLEVGRDDKATMVWPRTVGNKHACQSSVIRRGAVLTPLRQHHKWGLDHRCPMCQHAHADWKHFVDDCPGVPVASIASEGLPNSLRYTGNVPKGFADRPCSTAMHKFGRICQVIAMFENDQNKVHAGSDGGCMISPWGDRAGWGFSFEGGGDLGGPVEGPYQTAQRAEVYAVLQVLAVATGPVVLYSDSKYVCDKLNGLSQGSSPEGAHSDLWCEIHVLLPRLHSHHWVKAHLTKCQAAAKGISERAWDLNRRADAAATRGIQEHVEDAGAHALFGFRMLQVVEWQKHLLRVYHRMMQAMPKSKPNAGLIQRIRRPDPSRCPRKQRTEALCKSGHAIVALQGSEACMRCGRTTQAGRQGRLQQWRRPCLPLVRHSKALSQGHLVVWSGSLWRCRTCSAQGKCLGQVLCADHKSVGTRGTGQQENSKTGQKRLTSMWGELSVLREGSEAKRLKSGLRSTQQVSELGPLKPSAIEVLMKAAKVRKPSVMPRAPGGRSGRVKAADSCKGVGTLHKFFKPRT